MLRSNLVQIAMEVDDQGIPIKKKDKRFAIFFYVYDPDTGEEKQEFAIVDGRQRACDTIMEMQSCAQIDIMKSQVLSGSVRCDGVNEIVFDKTISCYTFLRYCVDPDYFGDDTIQFGNDGNGNFFTTEDLNTFVLSEYEDILFEMGIYSEDDLNRFYKCDFNYMEYVPAEDLEE